MKKIFHIVVGNDGWAPTQKQLDIVKELFLSADPESTFVVTRDGITVKDLGDMPNSIIMCTLNALNDLGLPIPLSTRVELLERVTEELGLDKTYLNILKSELKLSQRKE